MGLRRWYMTVSMVVAVSGCSIGDDGTCDTAECQSGIGDGPSRDGRTENSEPSIDCGGSGSAPRCEDGKRCVAASDCVSRVCKDATCQAPRADDGVKNGDETDVDCGGTTTGAPKCAAGKVCTVHADCISDGCDDQKKCALSRSCTQTNGGLTCGSGEVGDPNAAHESCCIALPVPETNTKLDKYKTTAGRMRAFIERVSGNVLDWYEKNKDSLPEKARSQIEPVKSTLPTDLDTYPTGANYQLGGFSFIEDRPSTSQGCYVGNANDKAYGSHTYWTGSLMDEDRAFDQDFLDRLPLNCVPAPLAAAFCAWDGGRLQTWEENWAAYGPGAYPWGDAPVAGGFGDVNGTWAKVGPADYGEGQTLGPCPDCDTTMLNWGNNYQNPAGGNPAKDWDLAYFISPPGRFPMDMGPGGHMDLGGILMELTASLGIDYPNLPAVDPTYGATIRWSRAGSWESHPVNYTKWQFPVMTKYGKTGMRCARD